MAKAKMNAATRKDRAKDKKLGIKENSKKDKAKDKKVKGYR